MLLGSEVTNKIAGVSNHEFIGNLYSFYAKFIKC